MRTTRGCWPLIYRLIEHCLNKLSGSIANGCKSKRAYIRKIRDIKSTRFGLGFEQNKSTTKSRLTILVLLTTLASVILILSGMVLFISGKTQRFKANTETRQTLSFHTLGQRAWVARTRFTLSQLRRTIKWLEELIDNAWPGRVLT